MYGFICLLLVCGGGGGVVVVVVVVDGAGSECVWVWENLTNNGEYSDAATLEISIPLSLYMYIGTELVLQWDVSGQQEEGRKMDPIFAHNFHSMNECGFSRAVFQIDAVLSGNDPQDIRNPTAR